ncbi:pentatricopeptide repeat-containing protein At2g20540-like [Nicotiana tabacum]|uniref:Pentatricopeptide repeat-containing protein At2g20540-like n=2 Tax=Nicotiana TaxID=4085 RepID=A0AC58RRR9_TOBAC|nr:PREDICTED: pentatricopeptide repeat-containing protein At4g02750-like [Nicotiana sylvestris]
MNQTVSHLLQTCKTQKCLKSIHAHLLVCGSIALSDLVLNKFIRLCSRFGAMDYARKLFDEITEPNPFLWTSMIHGYVENSQHIEAFSVFRDMRDRDVVPLNFTISSILKALGRLKWLRDGEGMFGLIWKCGFGFDLLVQNAMIDCFMRCGEVDCARRLFDGMEEKDIISWNSMVSGYVSNGGVEIARDLFDSMVEKNVVSWTSLICGYVRKGDMVEARNLFEDMPSKDLVAWNVMISGYMDIGDVHAASFLFQAMPFRETGTWNLMISGYCKVGELERARDYFEQMPRRNVASWTMMIDGYVKSGNLHEARRLFDEMPEKNVITWSTMIGGYTKHGKPSAALELFKSFKKQSLEMDGTFILSIISACSQLGIVDAAESIMSNDVGSRYFSDTCVVNSLIDLYAKCGNIEKASQVFEMADKKDLHCYSTMIAAFANHGLVEKAVHLFEDMQKENIEPDEVIFLGVLSACNHGGLINEGRRYFKQMTEEFKIQPTEKHYACMVDILGRGGFLEDANEMILSMHVAPTSAVWGAMLAACNVHRNVQMAEIAASELFKIEPENSGNYILLSNIYADAGRWRDVARVRAMIREHHVRKNRGSSWIELDSAVHEFVMGDVSHLAADRIYFMLSLLNEEMKLSGYTKDKDRNPISTLYPSFLSLTSDIEIDEQLLISSSTCQGTSNGYRS